ncbi:MAG: arsenic efflux protein [Clostridia bacterium]|nr:arsenic efflux protein [Clostridia bacterium]
MEHFWELVHHALTDTLPLLVWILLIYIVIELLESKADLKAANRFGGKYGPIVGSATGLIPQCGFSVMAAKLYEQKYLTLGTLVAIFFSTSDEAFIILLSSGAGAVWVLPTLAVKIALGILVGYGVDLGLRLLGRKQTCAEMPQTENGAATTVKELFIQNYLQEKDVDVVCSCGKNHDESVWWKKYLLAPLVHTAKVGAFIFLVNFLLTAIVHSVGEENFIAFMHRNRFVQPFIACAIGLIPNCASSVVITEAFLGGGIAFGSFVAGLCANAGMGFVVLLKNVRKWKRNMLLVAFCYCVSVLVGVLLNIAPLSVV